MLTEKELLQEITQKVSDFWSVNKSPFLVSQLGANHTKADIRAATKGIAIVRWIQENASKLKVKLIYHPTQKEKIGLIPANEVFEYENNIPKLTSPSNEKELTLAFLEMLKTKCTPQELDQIEIPTKILVKLLT